jgi:hypothetical protein
MSSLAEQMQKFCLQLTGCDLYTLASPVNGPGILLGTEIWTDTEAFEAHLPATRQVPEPSIGRTSSSTWTSRSSTQHHSTTTQRAEIQRFPCPRPESSFLLRQHQEAREGCSQRSGATELP